MTAIRRASRDDEPWIRSLIPRLFEFGPPPTRDLAPMIAAAATATAGEARATVAASDGPQDQRIVLVASDDRHERLGFVHLETAADFFTHERHGHISTLVVSPDAERRGVGRALLDAAEAWCRERSY